MFAAWSRKMVKQPLIPDAMRDGDTVWQRNREFNEDL
jgi:hypothetical protein